MIDDELPPEPVCDSQGRFGGIQRLYGSDATEILANAHVCVVGAGGVGSWAIEALARTAVGHLTLIDYDDICPTNVNRQLHALDGTFGQKKIAAMADRVRAINPDCQVELIDDFITLANMEDYLSRGYDYVIDAIDSIKFKSAMIAFCHRRKIPIIATGGAGGLSDPTCIQIADLSRTHNDPLAAKVRAQLRQQYGFSKNGQRKFGIDCVFSSQQQVYPRPDGSVSHQKPGIHGVSLDCRFGYGSASFVTASFAFAAVARVVSKILDKQRRQSARSDQQ